MSKSKGRSRQSRVEGDEILAFLMHFMLDFGTGWAGLMEINATEWYWNGDTLSCTAMVSSGWIERVILPDADRRFRITQAGLDYIKNGHGRLSASEDKEN